jgi:hypothetical protein
LDWEPLADDGDEDINRDRNPDLGLDGVLAGAVKSLDTQVLLDPFEEELSGKGLARCADARPVSSPSP